MSCFSSFVSAYRVLGRKGKGRTRATEVRTKLRNAATMLKVATGKKKAKKLWRRMQMISSPNHHFFFL